MGRGGGGRRRVTVRQCKVAGSVEGQAGPGPDPSPGLEGQWGKNKRLRESGVHLRMTSYGSLRRKRVTTVRYGKVRTVLTAREQRGREGYETDTAEWG